MAHSTQHRNLVRAPDFSNRVRDDRRERPGPDSAGDEVTTIERPKGAMTNTAPGSKRVFRLYVVMTALSLIASVLDDNWDWASCQTRGTELVRSGRTFESAPQALPLAVHRYLVGWQERMVARCRAR